MQDLHLDGFAMWSLWQPERRMFFNSFFVRRAEGNIVVDPLALSAEQDALLEERGGVAWIVITNRDHERKAREIAARFGARLAAGAQEAALLSGPLDRTLHEGDSLFEGATILELPGGKTPGEIAIHLAEHRAAILGDALWGDPAGCLRLPPDEKLADPRAAVLGLRKIWALRLETLLVGDGACLFAGADKIIGDCLHARRDVYVNRINLDELTGKSFSDVGGKYEATSYEIGLYIGARKLGYRLVTLPPGKISCPLHAHAAEEELFLVLEGEATIRTLRGDVRCRAGDAIAFPVGDIGTHTLVNTGTKPCRVFMLGTDDDNESATIPTPTKWRWTRAILSCALLHPWIITRANEP
ncbi:MAG: cupin domain-containing protein [Candidatus Eremiobacteraeota bacterium]|nr:cupin domain-containing protein [Candidatus Eremiobacteraeota bacterium]